VTQELAQPISIFIVLVIGLTVGGFVDARVSMKHPEAKARLGNPVHLGPLSLAGLRHGWAWFTFLTFEHFREHDTVLSVLCMFQLLLGVAVVGALLGAWPLNFASLLPSAG